MDDRLFYPLCTTMAEVIRPHGLKLSGFSWYEAKQGQRKPRELYGTFWVSTTNPDFFDAGGAFAIGPRMRLPGLAYDKDRMLPLLQKLPYDSCILDVRVALVPPHAVDAPVAVGRESAASGVLKYEGAEFIPIEQAIADGSIAPESMFADYCKRYDLPHVLKHRRHFVSPDSASVEAFEAALQTDLRLYSILELGGGVGTCGVAARRAGRRDFTFADIGPTVCAYLRERFPEYTVVESDAFEFPLERQWHVVLSGIPYHLNPLFLEKRGAELARSCEIAIFNSGCQSFFAFDHDWVMGKESVAAWPWWKKAQTVAGHFPHVFEAAWDWQTVVVGGHDQAALAKLEESMRKRGFTRPRSEMLVWE